MDKSGRVCKNKGILATDFFTMSAITKSDGTAYVSVPVQSVPVSARTESHGLAYISIPVKSAPGPCSYTCLLPLGHCP